MRTQFRNPSEENERQRSRNPRRDEYLNGDGDDDDDVGEVGEVGFGSFSDYTGLTSIEH